MRHFFCAIVLTVFSLGASAGQYSYILRFDRQVDVQAAYGDMVESSTQLLSLSTYRVNIVSDQSESSVRAQLADHPSLIAIESNHVGQVDDSIAKSVLDTRPGLILDTRPGLILDDGAEITDATRISSAALASQEFLYQIAAPDSWRWSTGRGITVAVLDTGAELDHPYLVNNLVPGYDFVDDDMDPSEEVYDLDSNENGIISEGYGHGTHVAGIIRAVAPGAGIMPIRVVDQDGVADTFAIAQGIAYALQHGAQVINMSMSLPEASPTLRMWIDIAKRMNVLVVTSAGNNNSTEFTFPANESTVLTVASVGPDFRKSTFSNYGSLVDICAPGEGIISSHIGGTFIERSGTSMAAPIVAAQAAMILQRHPGTNFHRQLNMIENQSWNVDYYNPEYQRLLGKGICYILFSIQ